MQLWKDEEAKINLLSTKLTDLTADALEIFFKT